MSYPQIEAYMQREQEEGNGVRLVLEPVGDIWEARIVDQGQKGWTLLDRNGERYMRAQGDTPADALDQLEELAI
jgi:hypothetical protein